MELWNIIIPTANNDGRPFRTRHHRVWDKKVRVITGGLTIYQPVRGQWVAPDGTLFVERMIPVLISCSCDQIELIADWTAKHYGQKAVLFWLVSKEVCIKHY